MPADSRITIREYREGDEQKILELFARSFPHAPRTIEHFHWKYIHSPFGNERISLAFDETGGLVGHYAGYVVPFRALGRNIFANQIGDTMTDPSVRHIGRGPTSVLGKTALHFYEHFCEGTVAFNYGFNVANIHKFSLRFLRADRVEPVSYRMRDLKTHPLKPPARRLLGGYQIEIVDSVDKEWDAFFERVSAHYQFLVRRDARYVRWRYFECPDTQYTVLAIRKWRRLVGWIAYRVRDDRFLWGDALFDRRHARAIDAVLRHAVAEHPVNAIEGWFPPRPSWFDAALRANGFEIQSEPQDLSVMCVPFMWSEAVASMRQSLYYTWSDSDLF